VPNTREVEAENAHQDIYCRILKKLNTWMFQFNSEWY